MKKDQETKKNLLASAKTEFLEKGYMQASLRNICKNAGVTTGALYFFFKDKEDLFASLVEEPLNDLYKMMQEHYLDEKEQADSGEAMMHDISQDIEMARQVIGYMYRYHDAFQLLLEKSQGSRFENFVDRFVEISEEHFRVMADAMAKQTGREPVEDYIIHWLTHLLIDIFMHMMTHEVSEKDAEKYAETMVRYLVAGWVDMFNVK